jgi:hypothetical protein
MNITEDALELLTKWKFHAWVASKPIAAKIGLSGEAYACPIAVYLAQSLRNIGYDIELAGIGIATTFISLAYNGQDGRIETPHWAKEFVIRIDNLVPYSVDILREQALKVVDAIQ